ncbi:alkaline phosphatase family protein [Candidatus Acidulodesulfobacterium sp. H_13]|uniref:alkaline phosphatase family protein n=1 Tax=Candidatus Acidulodesulfobacterium sp. H_13 TaxID=3395470 RepID=UPI003AF69DCB
MRIKFFNVLKKSIRKIKVKKPFKKNGFVIFQIDGLSYKAIRKALSLKLMPHLQKMIDLGDYSFGRYFTGVPSDTPSFQAGLLYGDNNDVPGFRWIEKETGREIIFKQPDSAGMVEELLAGKKPGLLTGGSSYVNLFSGGASRSTFTLSTFSIRYLFKRKVRNFDIFIVFIFHIFTFLKTFLYVFFEFLLEIWERIMDAVKKRKVRPEGFFPFARAMSNVIFKEIETFGAIMDISRGVPSIYLNYIGYDELSHHRGPYSLSALRTLKAIDRKIHHIYKEISNSERNYDFFIISDHGHTPSVPFSELNNGKKLKSVIEDCVQADNIKIFEFDTGYNIFFKQLFLYISDFFKRGTCNKILNKVFGRIESREANEREKYDEKLSWERSKIVYIMNSGPMANVYLSGKTSKVFVEEIERNFPKLIDILANTPGIGFIIGMNGNAEVVAYDKNFKKFHNLSRFFSDNAKSCATVRNIINNYENDKERNDAFSSVERFCKFKNSGDIILFGEYDGDNVVNFENQMGAHGGIGGEQNIPFAVWQKSISLDFRAVNNSCKIYEFLYNNYVK